MQEWYLQNHVSEQWAYKDDLFSKNECEKIIEMFSNKVETARIADNTKIEKVRKSNVHFIDSSIEDNKWIFRKITDCILNLNHNFFRFDIEKIETLQFTEYCSSYKGFYQRHVDTAHHSVGFRKLSFSIQLTDDNDYEGGDVLFHNNAEPDVARRNQGSLSMFPSYLMHEVTPVTKGRRYAIVGWVWGPRFR